MSRQSRRNTAAKCAPDARRLACYGTLTPGTEGERGDRGVDGLAGCCRRTSLPWQVLQRGVAILYVVAFLSSLDQFPALLGERGLLPVPDFLAGSSRACAGPPGSAGVTRTGCCARCAGGGMGLPPGTPPPKGCPQAGPPWVPLLASSRYGWGTCRSSASGRRSTGSAGRCCCSRPGSSRRSSAPTDSAAHDRRDRAVLVAGVPARVRRRHDQDPRRPGVARSHGATYHHETQPMPGPLSRQAHLLPRLVPQARSPGNHFAAARRALVPVRSASRAPGSRGLASASSARWPPIVIATQLWLVATGNFAWLNWRRPARLRRVSDRRMPGSGDSARLATRGMEPPWPVDGSRAVRG